MSNVVTGPRGWLSPPTLAKKQTSGFVGFYTRNYLPDVFDLVDRDGFPGGWLYWKRAKRVWRFLEEKPYGQELHNSQRRTFSLGAQLIEIGIKLHILGEQSGFYVVWDAERLVDPDTAFPMKVTKIRMNGEHETREMSRSQFDDWFLLERVS